MSKSLCLFLLLGSYYVSPHEEVMSFAYFIQRWMAPFNWMESNGFPVVWMARLWCFRSQWESKNKLVEAAILKFKGIQQGQCLRCEITGIWKKTKKNPKLFVSWRNCLLPIQSNLIFFFSTVYISFSLAEVVCVWVNVYICIYSYLAWLLWRMRGAFMLQRGR